MTTLEMRMNLLNQISGTDNLAVLRSILQQAVADINNLLSEDRKTESLTDNKLNNLIYQMNAGQYKIPQVLKEIGKGVNLPDDINYKDEISQYLEEKYA